MLKRFKKKNVCVFEFSLYVKLVDKVRLKGDKFFRVTFIIHTISVDIYSFNKLYFKVFLSIIID